MIAYSGKGYMRSTKETSKYRKSDSDSYAIKVLLAHALHKLDLIEDIAYDDIIKDWERYELK